MSAKAAGIQVRQRVDHRLLHAIDAVARHGVGQVVAPFFQRGAVRDNQVGHHAGLVNERTAADDGGVFVAQGGAEAHAGGQSVHRVGVVDDDQANRAVINVGGGALPVAQRRRRHGGLQAPVCHVRVHQQAAFVSRVAHDEIQHQGRRSVELAVAVGAGLSAATDGQAAMGRVVVGQVVEEIVERLPAQHGVGYLQYGGVGVGRELAERAGAGRAGDGLNVGRFGMRFGNCPSQGHGGVAFGAGRDGNPLVGVGCRHGVARAKVDVRSPMVGVLAAPELAVGHLIRGGATPGGKEVGAETYQRIGVFNVVVRQRVGTQHILDRAAIGGIVRAIVGQVAPAESVGEVNADAGESCRPAIR